MAQSQKWLSSPLGAAVLAVAGVGATAFLAYLFNGVHPPDNVYLRAHHISSVSVRDSATAQFFAYAQGLRIAAVTGAVDVVLPAPTSECQQLANQLQATCDTSGITVTNSLEVAWDTPELITLSPSLAGNRIDLSAVPADGGAGLQLTVTDGVAPSLCLTRDVLSAKLTLTQAGSVVTVPPSAPGEVPDCKGLVVHVMSPNPTETSGFVLFRLKDAAATLVGKQMVVGAQDLSLTLISNSIDSNPKGPIELDSDRSFSMTTSGLPPDVQAPNDLQVPHATHVIDAGAERLQSSLNRYPESSYVVSGAPAFVALIVFLLARFATVGVRPEPAGQGDHP